MATDWVFDEGSQQWMPIEVSDVITAPLPQDVIAPTSEEIQSQQEDIASIAPKGDILSVLKTSNPDKFIVNTELPNKQGSFQTTMTAAQVKERGGVLPTEEQQSTQRYQGADIFGYDTSEVGRLQGKTEAERKLTPEYGGAAPKTETITETPKDVLKIGIRTDNPEEIKLTDAIKSLQKDYPDLYKVLVNEGYNNYERAVNAINFEYQQAGVISERQYQANKEEFEKNLKNQPKELQEAYRASGISGYNRAVKEYNANIEQNNVKLPDGVYMSDADMKALPEKYSTIALTKGYEAMNKVIEADNKASERALKEIEPYKTKGENTYNLIKYLQDEKAGQRSWKETQLQAIGYSDSEIKELEKQADMPYLVSLGKNLKTQLSTPKGAINLAGDFLIPFKATAKNWDDYSPNERATSLVLDGVTVAAYIFGAGEVVGAARGAATVSRAAMIKAVVKNIADQSIAQAKAPFTMIAHPLETGKVAFRSVANVVEDLTDLKKVPYAVFATSTHTTRIPITPKMTAAESMAVRDLAMETFAAKGGKVAIQTENYLVEIKESPFMEEARKAGNALATGTPDITPFKEPLTVQLKYRPTGELKPPDEQGLFFAQEPLERFAQATSGGRQAEIRAPGFYIASKETAEAMRTSGKTYQNTAELERVLPVGKTTAGDAQKLYTRIGNLERAEILLEKPLSNIQLATLKAKAVPSAIKSLYSTAFEIKGKGLALSSEEVKNLANALRESGNVSQADDLLRAERIALGRGGLASVRSTALPRADRRDIELAKQRLLSDYAVSDKVNYARLPAREYVTAYRVGNIGVTRTDRLADISRINRTPLEIRAEMFVATRRETRTQPTRAERLPVDRTVSRTPITRTARNVPTERLPRTPQEQRVFKPGEPVRPLIPRVPIEPVRYPPGKPVKPPKIPKGKGSKPTEMLKPGKKSPITWRQGIVWWTISYPYTAKSDISVSQKPPQGAFVTDGIGSAYRTVQALGGNAQLFKSLDMGIMDIGVKAKEGEKPAIRYKLDTRQRTHGEISLKGIRG